MSNHSVDVPRLFPSRPELAAIALFTLMIDAHQSGDSRKQRALTYRLWQLGWRAEPIEPPGEGVAE
jgi:hypothetical protein